MSVGIWGSSESCAPAFSHKAAEESMAGRSRKYRVLIGKPGLDGHDRGAKILARALRDAGFEAVYTGIRRTADEIAAAAVQEDVSAVGLSSLSGAHLRLFPAVVEALKQRGAGDIPVLGGGVIPDEDLAALKQAGIVEVYTPGTPLAQVVEAFENACDRHQKGRSGK